MITCACSLCDEAGSSANGHLMSLHKDRDDLAEETTKEQVATTQSGAHAHKEIMTENNSINVLSTSKQVPTSHLPGPLSGPRAQKETKTKTELARQGTEKEGKELCPVSPLSQPLSPSPPSNMGRSPQNGFRRRSLRCSHTTFLHWPR